MMTFELGRIMHCRFPAFSALLMVFNASLSTDVRTMLAVVVDIKSSHDDVSRSGGTIDEVC